MATLTTSWQKICEAQLQGNYSLLQVYAKYNSQSTTNNTSNISVELRIVNGNASFHCYTHSCNFNGGTFDGSSYVGSYYHGWEANTSTTILSQTKDVSHNADGTLTFNLGGYFTCSAGISGTAPNTSVSLPKINRKSALSLSKSTFNIGETIQATITQYVSAYHQDLYIVISGNDVLVKSNVSGTENIDTSTIASQIYASIPNAKYLSSNFKLKTYDSNNTLIGTDTKSFTANVVNSNPTFNVAYEDTNNTTKTITGNNQQIIQRYSTLRIKITNASAKNSASLSSVSVNINGSITTDTISSASKNIDIGTLNLSSNTTASITITDSRGFTTTNTLTIQMLEYHIPFASITLQRQQNFYTLTYITVDADYSSLDSNNTITIQYRYKKQSDGSYGSWNNLSDNVQSSFNADNRYAWNVQVKLTDRLNTYTYENLSVGVGSPIFFVDKAKQSCSVFGMPNYTNSLELNGVDLSNTYDTTERPIGRWIDGSIIYRKTFNIGAVSSSQQIQHGISNFDKLVKVYGVGGNEGVYSPLPYVNTSANAQWGILVSSSMILLSKGSSATNFDECYITIEYTKSS